MYQVLYNIKKFCLHTFHKCKTIYDFYSLLISQPVTFYATVYEFGETSTFWVISPFDYFHKMKTDFHKKQVS